MTNLHTLPKTVSPRLRTAPSQPDAHDTARVPPDPAVGLTREQVQARMDEGLQNFDATPATRSERQIILRNICTLFNLVNILFFVAIVLVGSMKDTLFMVIVAANTLIGIVQEIRAKHAVDSLSFLSAAHAVVLRDGRKTEIPIEEIVIDDVLFLSSGDQVPTDSVVLADTCDVDESFLTGESDAVPKSVGDTLLAGSFIVSGSVRARASRVGGDNYISKISTSAKTIKKEVSSEMMRTMQTVIAFVSIALIPISIILFRNQLALPDATIRSAVLNTTAALIAMVPEGLMLLTSTILAASVTRLSQKKVMVQELYCIESLARVDVLCLDKTGTITEGVMTCVDAIPLDRSHDIPQILSSIASAFDEHNATLSAIARRYTTTAPWRAEKKIPFSSRTKWSGAAFGDKGAYFMGAAEFLFPHGDPVLQEAIENYSKDHRVVALAYSADPLPSEGLPSCLQAVAIVLLQDTIREDAPETLRYFKEQGVVCKVISGDNADTVAGIARRAGVDGWERAVDLSKLSPKDIAEAAEKYTVFGRVTPEQKKELVHALREKGHTVAMTGDGVNDVMALREADCSISIANGAEAARNVSQLVLLNSNFSALPKVVEEGRRAINNIERSASLYLVKTVYATLLSIAFLFLTATYPFEPIHLTLIGLTTTGIPSVVLGLQPNHERVRGHFLPNVLTIAVPCGGTVAAPVLMAVVCGQIFQVPQEQVSALCVLLTGGSTLILLFHVCHPWNNVRIVLFTTMNVLFFAGYFGLHSFFSIAPFELPALLLLILISAASWELFRILWQTLHRKNVIFFPTLMKDQEQSVS